MKYRFATLVEYRDRQVLIKTGECDDPTRPAIIVEFETGFARIENSICFGNDDKSDDEILEARDEAFDAMLEAGDNVDDPAFGMVRRLVDNLFEMLENVGMDEE